MYIFIKYIKVTHLVSLLGDTWIPSVCILFLNTSVHIVRGIFRQATFVGLDQLS